MARSLRRAGELLAATICARLRRERREACEPGCHDLRAFVARAARGLRTALPIALLRCKSA